MPSARVADLLSFINTNEPPEIARHLGRVLMPYANSPLRGLCSEIDALIDGTHRAAIVAPPEEEAEPEEIGETGQEPSGEATSEKSSRSSNTTP